MKESRSACKYAESKTFGKKKQKTDSAGKKLDRREQEDAFAG